MEVDGIAIRGVGDLQRLMVAELIGKSLPVRISRSGRDLTLELTPAELR